MTPNWFSYFIFLDSILLAPIITSIITSMYSVSKMNRKEVFEIYEYSMFGALFEHRKTIAPWFFMFVIYKNNYLKIISVLFAIFAPVIILLTNGSAIWIITITGISLLEMYILIYIEQLRKWRLKMFREYINNAKNLKQLNDIEAQITSKINKVQSLRFKMSIANIIIFIISVILLIVSIFLFNTDYLDNIFSSIAIFCMYFQLLKTGSYNDGTKTMREIKAFLKHKRKSLEKKK